MIIPRFDPAFPLWKKIECGYVAVVLFSAQSYFPEGQSLGNFAIEAAKGIFDRARDNPCTEDWGESERIVPNVYGLADVDLGVLEVGPFGYVGFASGDVYGSGSAGFVTAEAYQNHLDEVQAWIDNGRPHHICDQWYHRRPGGGYEITNTMTRPV